MKYSMIRKQIFPAFLLSVVLAACPGSTCGAEESMAEESLSFSEEIISDELFEDWSVPEEEPAGISPDDFGQSGFAEDNHEVASGAKTAVPAEDEGTEDVYTPDMNSEDIYTEDTYSKDTYEEGIFAPDGSDELIEDEISGEIIFEDSEELAIGTGRPGFSTAKALPLGSSVSVAGDTWFKLTIPSGAKTVYRIATTSGSGTDPYLYLYNPDGALVSSAYGTYEDEDSPTYKQDAEIRVSLSEGTYYLLVEFFVCDETPGKTCTLKAATYLTGWSAAAQYEPGLTNVDAWIYVPKLDHVHPGQSITLTAGWATVHDKEPTFKWELVPVKYIQDTEGTWYWDIDESKPRQPLPSTTTQVTFPVSCGCGEMIRIGFTAIVSTAEGYDYMDDYIDILVDSHEGDVWTRTKEPTVFSEGTQVLTCKYCGQTMETRTIAKPVPCITMNVALNSTIPLKIGQSTKKIKVTGLQADDYVISWKSSKPKIASVSKEGKITGKKKGKAVITVTTAAGATYSFKIKVQPQKVATKKIVTASPKTITIKEKGKVNIGAELVPITTLDKLSYTTSNRKIATVKKGTITAAGKGTATITVRAGKKQIRIKVKVTN